MIARNPRVLLLVDDAALRASLQMSLASAGTNSIACTSTAVLSDAEIFAQIESARPKIFCSQFDARNPTDVLRINLVMNLFPRLAIILVGSNQDAILPQATQQGNETQQDNAFLSRITAFIPQPWHPHEIARSVSAALCPDECDTRQPSRIDPFLIGRSQEMQQVSDAIARLADDSRPILIQGEHGTGKRLTALAMHSLSRHRSLSIHTLDCGDLGSEHLAGLLFGPPKSPKLPPMLEDARIGTIVLSELAAISPAVQSKLIDWIRTRNAHTITPKIVFTTSRDLGRLVANRKVRADLFLELSNQVIGLPPLRHRRGDIRLLVDYFAQHLNNYLKRLQFLKGPQRSSLHLDENLYQRFERHPWPYNVRELRAVLVATALRETPQDVPAVAHLEKLLANPNFNAFKSFPTTNPDATASNLPREVNNLPREADNESGDSVHPTRQKSSLANEPDIVAEPNLPAVSMIQNTAPDTKSDGKVQSDPQQPTQDNKQQYWASMVDRFAADESPNIYARALEMFEKELLTRVLDRTGGNIQDSARLLGMTNLSLKKKIQHLEIKVPEINA